MTTDVERFLEQVVGNMAGLMTSVFTTLGDRLGLFEELARGAGTSGELAERMGLHERYIREWARGLVAAGYLTFDAPTERFSLPAEHVPVLAEEGGPAFLGGVHQLLWEMVRATDAVEEAFRSGGGVALSEYGESFWDAMTRTTGPSFEHQLVQEWIPAVQGLQQRLEAGVSVADVGCGTGVAAITLARAFPRSTVRGFDIHEPNVTDASKSASEVGVSDRVTFARIDAVGGIPGTYDLITFFNVVHDAGDPLALLRAARDSLEEGGVCVIQEIDSHDDPADNVGPIGAVTYGMSLLHCMPQSLAEGGAGLGTCGLPERELRELATEAGFAGVNRVAEGPLDAIYELRP